MCLAKHKMGYRKRTDAESLVLPADKDSRQEVTTDEQQKKQIMQRRVIHGVVNAEADEADGAHEREEHAQHDEDLLRGALVAHEAPAVPQPALRQEGEVESDGGEDGAADEEGLHLVGADVADVGEGLAVGDGGIASAVRADDPVEEQAEEHAEPYEAGQDGQPLRFCAVSIVCRVRSGLCGKEGERLTQNDEMKPRAPILAILVECVKSDALLSD